MKKKSFEYKNDIRYQSWHECFLKSCTCLPSPWSTFRNTNFLNQHSVLYTFLKYTIKYTSQTSTGIKYSRKIFPALFAKPKSKLTDSSMWIEQPSSSHQPDYSPIDFTDKPATVSDDLQKFRFFLVLFLFKSVIYR